MFPHLVEQRGGLSAPPPSSLPVALYSLQTLLQVVQVGGR